MSTLGSKLRDARIEKGYTLNTLQQMTKIQKKYLVAIEEGQFSELPGNFYIRAFVKQYADVVGLNGDELLKEYKDEIEVYPDEDEMVEIENIETEEIGSRVKSRQENQEKSNLEILLTYLPLAFLIGLILMIIFSLSMAISRMNDDSKSNKNDNANTSSIVSTVEPESLVTTTSTTNEETTQATQDLAENQIKIGDKVLTLISNEGEESVYEIQGDFNDYTFGVKGKSYVWIGMYEDENIVVDTSISEGEDFEYTVNEGVTSFRIRLGYQEGGTFTVNGQELELNNPYFGSTVVFQLADDAASQEVEETTAIEEVVEESVAEEPMSETGYQGPAVLQGQDEGNNN
ncbi:hypothetical protein HMPREF2811_00965 [Globicatella sp. HMSC072A10]|nr:MULTISPECIES: helix-turn-helix domain-containing protein [Globicatella]OFK58593.1 hypothetical protein HMPREF2811_00965 [Globicatella sp. HMSC072A10]